MHPHRIPSIYPPRTVPELTLLSNRRGFLPLAQHTLNLCRRRWSPAFLLYFDSVHFKQINDRWGHAEVDRALSAFGRLLIDTLRESDVIARLFGDEIVVLLSGTAQSESTAMVDRLRQTVQAYNKQQRERYDIRFSVGISKFDANQHHLVLDLLNAADQQMYKHKRIETDGSFPPVQVAGSTWNAPSGFRIRGIFRFVFAFLLQPNTRCATLSAPVPGCKVDKGSSETGLRIHFESDNRRN